MREKDVIPRDHRGMSLRFMNVLLILLAVIVSVVLFYDVFNTANSYKKFREATERYLSSERDAAALRQGSDYLTEQSRLFAVTGEPVYLDNYFNEAKVTKSRDSAVEHFKTYLDGTEEYRYLSAALEYSNRLMEQEYRSMKLRAMSIGMDMKELPSEVSSAEIGANDAGLSAEGQKDRAISIVFSDLYMSYKTRIYENISKSVDELTNKNKEEQIDRSEQLLSNFRLQTVLIIAAFLIVLGMMLLTSKLVIMPMTQALRYISDDKKIPVTGSDEMRVLAETYNQMYDSNAQKKMELSFAANHDAMTGLYNRAAYLKALSDAAWKEVAVLVIDVDSFKQINDKYGHAIGDKVLIAVADALTTVFRADDFVCRIGGDEFIVVMKNTGLHLKELIRSKVTRAQDIVSEPKEEGVPSVSLSIGVAFGDWSTDAQGVANNADVALYKVKNGGKKGYAFFDEMNDEKD